MPDMMDKFDIDKQLAERKSKATTRILVGYSAVIFVLFIAFGLIGSFAHFFLVDHPFYFILIIVSATLINGTMLYFFIIKPSDKSSVCLDLMSVLNQKFAADMKMHILKIETFAEEMECMSMSGKYPRMFMMTLDPPDKPFLNEVFKVPVFYKTPSARLDLMIKHKPTYVKSKLVGKNGGLFTRNLMKKFILKKDFWATEFTLDKERNMLIYSVYFGERTGEDMINTLAKKADEMLKSLKDIESGK